MPDAGRIYFNLGKAASYDAAKHGHLPVGSTDALIRIDLLDIPAHLGRDIAQGHFLIISRLRVS